jgi:flagellar biogenesis protein FliO
MEYMRQLLSIAGVLGLLAAVLYVLKRRAPGGGLRWSARRGRKVQIVERAALTPQHSLHVVRVGKDLLLLSAGPGGVALLKKLEDGEMLEPATEEERR